MNMQSALKLNCDPVIGHVSVGEIDATCKTDLHQSILWALVQVCPGLTSAEYAKRPECKCFGGSYYERRVEAARRLPELVEPMRVRQGHKKKCPVNNTPAFAWWPFSFGKSFDGGASA